MTNLLCIVGRSTGKERSRGEAGVTHNQKTISALCGRVENYFFRGETNFVVLYMYLQIFGSASMCKLTSDFG